MSQLTAEARHLLLSLARRSLEAAVRREPKPPLPQVPGVLELRLGAFVSVHKKHELRGCIGFVQAQLPLYRTVMEAAAAAALQDPRFPPLEPSELPDVELEISVLSPFRAVRPEEIEVGAHGLMITLDRARGLLLPQVAVARQWDRERFLEETCRKAGLSPDAWRRGATIEGFTAEVFREGLGSPGREDQPLGRV